MLELNSRDARFLSRMGSRGTLGQVVYDYLNDGNDLFVVSADLAHASGFDRIKNEFPECLVNVGIAEQNLIGVAAGLSSMNTPVIATSWAMFTSMRVADQVRNYMGFMQSNVKLIGMDSGFIQSKFSYSHTNPPDIAVMRAIPGIKILSPCDGIETYKAINEAIKCCGPVYIRLTGDSTLPIVHKSGDFCYEIGKSIVLKEGTDVAIVATGNIVNNVIKAAEILESKGISAMVIDMHTIEPLDLDMLLKITEIPLVVSVEEHLIHGGMGSAIAEFYAECNLRPRHVIMGVNDCYPKSGKTAYVEYCCGLTKEQIADTIHMELSK